ncbi:MAG: hypothetical protein JRI68_07860 [Deltaproteobacteria bacterium]|nr:hypothetical protein [Deltaproteobacteria bacterium]
MAWWERVLGLFGIRPYAKSLRFISGPTRVRLRATIVSDNDQVSPVTQMRAAVFDYAVAQVYEKKDSDGYVETVYEALATAKVSSDLVLECADGKVLAPPGSFAVEHVGTPTPLSFAKGLPPEVEHGLHLHTRGALSYGEQFLRQGDEVELRGMVGPSARPGIGWEAVEGVVLKDVSLEGLI